MRNTAPRRARWEGRCAPRGVPGGRGAGGEAEAAVGAARVGPPLPGPPHRHRRLYWHHGRCAPVLLRQHLHTRRHAPGCERPRSSNVVREGGGGRERGGCAQKQQHKTASAGPRWSTGGSAPAPAANHAPNSCCLRRGLRGSHPAPGKTHRPSPSRDCQGRAAVLATTNLKAGMLADLVQPQQSRGSILEKGLQVRSEHLSCHHVACGKTCARPDMPAAVRDGSTNAR